MKKGFTLIELFLVIIILGLLSAYYFQNRSFNDFLENLKKTGNDVVNIVNIAVTNAVKGYPNATGDPCSDDNTYNGLTAGKAIKCVGWENSPFEINGDVNNADDSYVNLLKEYGTPGCRLYIGKGLDDDEFKVFLDCSSINYESGAEKYKRLAEEVITGVIKENLGLILKNVDRKATSLSGITETSSGSGSLNDGKVGYYFKK